MVYAVEEILHKEFRKRREEGMKEGMKVGMKEGIEKAAKNFLDMGMTIEQVAKGTGLSCDRIRELNCKAN